MDLTRERSMELLNKIVARAKEGKTDRDAIRILLQIGFTPMELASCFQFDRMDIRSAMTDGAKEITFGTLYNVADFTGSGAHIEGSDWNIVIDNENGRRITLYRRQTPKGIFYKRLELSFEQPDMVIAKSFAPYDEKRINKKAVSLDMPIRSREWVIGMFGKAETEWECAEVMACYVEMLELEKGRIRTEE